MTINMSTDVRSSIFPPSVLRRIDLKVIVEANPAQLLLRPDDCRNSTRSISAACPRVQWGPSDITNAVLSA